MAAQTDKSLAGVIIACTALYVLNFAYSWGTYEASVHACMHVCVGAWGGNEEEKDGQRGRGGGCSIGACARLPSFASHTHHLCFAGPLGWVVAAEVFPQRLRGKGMTLTTLANWLTNFMIAKTVPLVRESDNQPATAACLPLLPYFSLPMYVYVPFSMHG